MKKTSLTRALLVAGVMAAAGSLAQADAIFYPDGTHVELGDSAVENGLAGAVLARSATTAPSQDDLLAMGVLADQDRTVIASSDDTMVDTRTLGAGPANMSRATTTTVTTTTPVYVFPNINWDRHVVLSQPHPMMSGVRSLDMDRSAAATFDSPTRAGEASTMTGGAPNMLTTNEPLVTSLPAPVVVTPDTTLLGAGPSTLSSPSSITECGSNMSCTYLPD
jgi:hypothetical protein